MFHKSLAVAGAATLLAAGVAGTAQASVTPEYPGGIEFVKQNVVVSGADRDTATIMAKYTCTGTPLHLWASVKQGPNLSAPDHLSSTDADAWYETPEEVVPTCDGETHVLRYTVTRADGWDRLHKGTGYVQFVYFYLDADGNFVRDAASGFTSVKAPRSH